MASAQLVKDFNRALLAFIKDLSTSFPQVEGFRRAFASTNLVATMNATLVPTLFNRYMSKYTKQILRRDDAFFIDKDYSSDFQEASTGESIEIVSIIKGIWATLGAADRDNIWRHLEVLVALNHTIVNNN